MQERNVVVAVDVGTTSARAGIVDRRGRLLARAECPISMNQPLAGHAEHDSQEIWHAVCQAVREVRRTAGIAADAVDAIGFDATCSLVVRGSGGEPVTVSTGGEARWDTIVWLDHRAACEAALCTATGHEVVAHAGGALSPEMATPKLLWLKRHLPQTWAAAAQIFDLADFLTWKASGSNARSQCTLTCKWTYLAHRDPPWRADYLAAIGLDDLMERAGLPQGATAPGTALGPLLREAADELGLSPRCRVAVGLIDAHAGALGAIGAYASGDGSLASRAALVAGTSSCVMAMTPNPHLSRGIWGPYLGAALPGLWLSEGGQSASGALLDHVVRIHGGGLTPDRPTIERIAARIEELRACEGEGLGGSIHVLPDFHGNRSPFAEPGALGAVTGLSMDASFDALCRLYWRTAVAVALGIRQVVEAMNASGQAIERLHLVGGHLRNPLLPQLYADATGLEVALPATQDSVLLGTAMGAAAAGAWHESLAQACRALHGEGPKLQPRPEARARFDHDYAVLKLMQRQRREIAALDASASTSPN